jgi:hypothetical protein
MTRAGNHLIDLSENRGPALGLGHPNSNIQAMCGGYACTGPMRALNEGDKAGAVYQHPESLSGTLPHSVVLGISQSSYGISGDLTVPSGKTFEVEDRVPQVGDPGDEDTPVDPITINSNGSILVNSGGTMTVGRDVTFEFSSAKRLESTGYFEAIGTSVDPVRFDPSGSSWAGISFEGGSSGTIQTGSVSGVSSSYGAIRVGYYATVTIDDVLLDNPSASSGIYLSGSSGTSIKNSSIAGSTYGIKFTSGASARLWQNVIDDASIAVDVDYYSTANLQAAAGAQYGGSNELGNSGSGYITLRSQHSATVYAGDASIHGDNEFCFGNESDADASTSSTIIAKHNYWPDGGPDVYGNVTATPYNYNRAAECSAVGKGFVASLPTYVEPPLDYDELSAAINLMYRAAANDDDAAFAEAAELLKGLRAGHSGTPMADAAMVGLYELSRLAGNAAQRSYFEQLASTAGPDRATALGLLVQAYRGSGDNQSARAAATSLTRLYPDQWHAFYAGLSIFEMDLDAGNFSQAASGLNRLVPSTEDELQKLDAAWTELVRQSNGAIQRSPTPSLPPSGKGIADSSTLTEASVYPNPFNPSTAVSFDLTAQSRVDVKVYDTLGRVIALLVQDKFGPGRHTVTWDAAAAPSGAYFVVVQAGKSTRTLPVTLLK